MESTVFSDLFGRIDEVPGLFVVATEFEEMEGVPLYPKKGWVVLKEFDGPPPGWSGVPIPLDRRSVLVSYTRGFAGLLFGISAVFGAIAFGLDKAPPDPTYAFKLAAPALVVLSGALYFLTKDPRLVFADYRRARQVAEAADLPLSHHLWIDVYFGRLTAPEAREELARARASMEPLYGFPLPRKQTPEVKVPPMAWILTAIVSLVWVAAVVVMTALSGEDLEEPPTPPPATTATAAADPAPEPRAKPVAPGSVEDFERRLRTVKAPEPAAVIGRELLAKHGNRGWRTLLDALERLGTRRGAVWAVEAMGVKAVGPLLSPLKRPLGTLPKTHRELIARVGEPALTQVHAMLRHEKARVSKAAVQILEAMIATHPQVAIRELANLLDHAEKTVRSGALDALERIPTDVESGKGVERLVWRLDELVEREELQRRGPGILARWVPKTPGTERVVVDWIGAGNPTLVATLLTLKLGQHTVDGVLAGLRYRTLRRVKTAVRAMVSVAGVRRATALLAKANRRKRIHPTHMKALFQLFVRHTPAREFAKTMGCRVLKAGRWPNRTRLDLKALKGVTTWTFVLVEAKANRSVNFNLIPHDYWITKRATHVDDKLVSTSSARGPGTFLVMIEAKGRAQARSLDFALEVYQPSR